MKLSEVEFRAMDSWWRRWGQEHFEIPNFCHMGLDVRNRDILEIGSGNGYGAYLLNRFSPRSYLGLDMMKEQVEKARKRYPQYQFLVQDATDLHAFPDASKDVVIIFGVLHHIPAWRKVVDEARRVLKPGGSFFVEEPRAMDLRLFDFFFRWGHPESDFDIHRMESYLRNVGFTIQNRRWTPLMTMIHAQSEVRGRELLEEP